MYNLISIGDATLDTFVQVHEATKLCTAHKKKCFLCFSWADKIPIVNLAQKVAGNAANVAIGSARLGLKTAIVTIVGEDETGSKLKGAFESEGVATEYVSVDKEKPSNYSVVLNFKGERTILVYHQPRYYSLPELKGAQWIYYTSLGNNYENLQEKLLTFLKAHKGIKLAFNPGTHQLKKELKGMKEVLKRCEIVFLNKEEAERIVGQAKDMTGLLEKLKATGPKIAVITDGVKGAYAFDGKEVWYLPSFPLKAIEKTGAGDSFATGFVAARFHGQPIPEALRWGAANATSVVQKIGPQDGLLTRQGVEEMLKRFEKIAPERKNL